MSMQWRGTRCPWVICLAWGTFLLVASHGFAQDPLFEDIPTTPPSTTDSLDPTNFGGDSSPFPGDITAPDGLGTAEGTEDPATLLQEAAQHLEAEEYQQAVQKYQQVISSFEATEAQEAEANYGLGKALSEVGQIEGALRTLRQATELDPTKKEYFYEFGALLNRIGDFAQAEANLTTAIDLDGTETYADAYQQRSISRRGLGDYEPAREDIDRAIQLDPSRKEYFYDLGLLLFQMELNAESLDAFARSIELTAEEEDYPEPYVARSAVYISQGKVRPETPEGRQDLLLALEDCRAASEIAPNEGTVYFNWGLIHRYLGEYDDAILRFTDAINRFRLSPSAGRVMAEAHLRRGITWVYMGEMALAAEEFDQAAKLAEGTATGPTLPASVGRMYLWKGIALAEQGRYADAIGAYSQALEIVSVYDQALINRSFAYARVGRPLKALEDINHYIRLKPSAATGYYHRGLIYEALDQPREAQASYARAIDLDPDHAAALGRRSSFGEGPGRSPTQPPLVIERYTPDADSESL